MSRITRIVFLVFLALGLGLNAVPPARGMANPAAIYCNDLGYRYEVKNSPEGQYGICILPDNSTCNEWDFFKGKCGGKFSYCEKKGYGTETELVSKGSYSEEYAVCVPKPSLRISYATRRIPMQELMENNGEGFFVSSKEDENRYKAGSGFEEIPEKENLLEQLKQSTNDNIRISTDSQTGKIRFIGTDFSNAIAIPENKESKSAEDSARTFLSSYGSLFGLNDQEKELVLMREKDLNERAFVRFQQIYSGIPVFGGELIVQTDPLGNIISANGEIVPDIRLDISPKINELEAKEKAKSLVAKLYGADAENLEATGPELWLYNPVVFDMKENFTRLVWRMNVFSEGILLPVNELVLIDANLGNAALHFSEIYTAKNRSIYDHGNTVGKSIPSDPSDLKRIEGGAATGITDVDNAYEYTGDTYDFYFNYHGRDSINNSGMRMVVTTRHCPDAGNCPYENAYWTSDYQQMVFGDGFVTDDVMGHELTHGVTSYESGLFYYMQSGAINEGFSDIWGEFIDLTNGAGNDDDSVRWLMGEDLSGGAIRSMEDPTVYSDPDRMKSANYYCGTSDSGGVHINSGVANKAAYLITDGNTTFNGYTLATGLGINKTARLFYEIQANLFTSASDYEDLYDALIQAAVNLNFTSPDKLLVEKAVNATQMNQQPTSCAANEAPVCDSGQVSNIFFDNLENTSAGYWASTAVSGTNRWYYPQNPNPYWDATYSTSGQYNFWGYDQGGVSDFYIAMTSNVSIPAGSRAYMRFNHAYSFEYSFYLTEFICWDGGIIEYSINGSPTWNNATSLITNNSYTGVIGNGYYTDNPLHGRSAFCSSSNGYISTRLNLSTLAGQNVRFRFRIGTDTLTDAYGWFIDDIRVYTCGVSNATYDISGRVNITDGTANATAVLLTLSGAASRVTAPNASSNYNFSGLSEGTYTVTPSLANYTFSPSSRSYSPLNSSQANQNFNGTYSDIPASFDWRNVSNRSYVNPIRDQGDCGSCYAFAAAASAEGVYNFEMNQTDENRSNFSESFIMWCLGRLPEYYSHFYGCDGADYDYMELEGLTTQGICSRENFPYTETDPGSCTHWNDTLTKFSEWDRIPCSDTEAIKTAIMTYGVIDAAVYVGSSFQSYSSGIYNDSNTACSSSPCYYTPTNHAIALVGWGHDDTYGDYWILRNSWGIDWGENESGYMRISAYAARVACEATYLKFLPEDPDINRIECSNGTSWLNCTNSSYGDGIEEVRANCTTNNSNRTIESVTFRLMNVPDSRIFFEGNATFNVTSSYWNYDAPDLTINDSGEWNLSVYCADSNGSSKNVSANWTIPWGSLESYLIWPTFSINVTQYEFFNFSSGVRCVTGECGNMNATLDPEVAAEDRTYALKSGDTDYEHPVMQPDKKTLESWVRGYNSAQKFSADEEFLKQVKKTTGGYFSLLSHLDYYPDERDQGLCGDCWQWAGTGVMETALDVQSGIFDRLSVQYMNSCEAGTIGLTCCEGGWLSNVSDFYNATRKAVPWSNTNADWQDDDASCDTNCGGVSTNPNYSISHIEELTITTQTVNQSTAIANIKSILNQNKSIFFAFYLPDDPSWDDFRDFWRNDDESAVYDMDKFCGIPYDEDNGGGHAVLCVGYNDTNASNPYWIMLNSWGNRTNRPNGLFNVNMNISYDCVNSPYYSFYWQTLNVTFDVSNGSKGIVPMNSGTPFYTISQNPQNCSDLKAGNSCNQIWQVNATGELFSSYSFYVLYNSTYGDVPVNRSSIVNIRISNETTQPSSESAASFSIWLPEGWSIISIPLAPG